MWNYFCFYLGQWICIRTPEFYNSRSPNGLWVKKFFVKTGDNDRFFFPHYQSLIIITTIDLSIVKNASQTDRRVTVFHWSAKVWYPVYGMNKFYKPKIEFPQSEFHCQMANKRKERYFWNIICSIIGLLYPPQ
jgi:hypothetical protein